jgi:hypothetical protein
MVHVENLIEPRARQILLGTLPPLPWSYRILRPGSKPRGGQQRVRVFDSAGSPRLICKERRSPHSNSHKITTLKFPEFRLISLFRIFHDDKLKSTALASRGFVI